MDSDGKFAGLAQPKPVVVAGPANGAAAALVPADAIRDFLKANGVNLGNQHLDMQLAEAIEIRREKPKPVSVR